jgi:hypothetical protein
VLPIQEWAGGETLLLEQFHYCCNPIVNHKEVKNLDVETLHCNVSRAKRGSYISGYSNPGIALYVTRLCPAKVPEGELLKGGIEVGWRWPKSQISPSNPSS